MYFLSLSEFKFCSAVFWLSFHLIFSSNFVFVFIFWEKLTSWKLLCLSLQPPILFICVLCLPCCQLPICRLEPAFSSEIFSLIRVLNNSLILLLWFSSFVCVFWFSSLCNLIYVSLTSLLTFYTEDFLWNHFQAIFHFQFVVLCFSYFLSFCPYLVFISGMFLSLSSISPLSSIRFHFTSSCCLAISSLNFYISALWWFLWFQLTSVILDIYFRISIFLFQVCGDILLKIEKILLRCF